MAGKGVMLTCFQSYEALCSSASSGLFMKGLWVVPDRTEEEVAVAAIAAGKARFEFGEKPDV